MPKEPTIEDTIEKYIYALLDKDGGTTAMPSAFRKAFKDIYNLGLQDMAEKSKEKIDLEKAVPSDGFSYLGFKKSKEIIDTTLKELTK